MFCEPCRRERPHASRYCVLCGSRLVVRKAEDIEAELTHVHWLLEELPRWDESLVSQGVRKALRAHFEVQAGLLKDALTLPAPAPTNAREEVAPPDLVEPPPPAEPQVPSPPVVDAVTPQEMPPQPVAEPSPVAVVAVRPPTPAQPSAWERLWKPVLGESVGWFIGAFLILAGTFTFVADAWNGMSDSGRSLTVFGLTSFWTLGFAAWAKMLERREATAPASVVLWRISAAVAPLATVALGPVTSWVGWPLVALQSLIAALLARKVAAHAWAQEDAARAHLETGAIALAMAGATVVLGTVARVTAAPLAWLEMVPVGLALVAWRGGRVSASGRPERFSLVAMGYAALLYAVRLHLAFGAEASWGLHAVMAAAAAGAALQLRPRSARAADAAAVLTVALQVTLLVPAFFAAAPAFVVAALIGAATTTRLAWAEAEPAQAKRAARWLGLTYVLGYAAFQRIDQLVPAVVVQWYQALKESLGYAAAPLPASYGSVYAALYVAAVGLWAARQRRSATDDVATARAETGLTCTTWGALAFGGLSLLSLQADARPALVAVPLLAVTTLGLGHWTGRLALSRAGAMLVAVTGLVWAWSWGLAWPVAALALVVAATTWLVERERQEAFGAAAVLLAIVASALSFTGSPVVGQAVALAMASAAVLGLSLRLDERRLLSVASLFPLLLVVRFGAPWMMGVCGLLAAIGLPRVVKEQERRGALWALVVVAALGAIWWDAALANDWPLVPLMLGASSLIVAARRTSGWAPRAWVGAMEGLGLVFAVAALAPLSHRFAEYRAWHAQVLSALVAFGASFLSVRLRHRWQLVLVACGVTLIGLGCAFEGDQGLWLSAVVTLSATGALLPSVTVPLAAATLAPVVFDRPYFLIAVAFVTSIFALLEEFDATWNWVLNRRGVAWAASLTSACALTMAAATTSGTAVGVVLACCAVLPLAWTRATRRHELLAVGLGVGALAGWTGGQPWAVVPPMVALLFGRGVMRVGAARRALNLTVTTPTALWAMTLVAGVASTALLHGPRVGLAWCAASVLLGGAPALNLAAGMAVAALTPEAQPWLTLVLMSLAIGLRHVEPTTLRLLGASRAGRTLATASLGAVGLAALWAMTTPGWAPPVLLAAALTLSAVLLGSWPLLSAAAVTLVMDLHAVVLLERLVLRPEGMWVAVAFAAIAAGLRLEGLGRVVASLWQRLGAAPGGEPATGFWWGGLVCGALALVEPTSVWLLVPALLLLTPVGTEAGLAAALGAGLVVLTTPHEVAGLGLATAGAALAWLGSWQVKRPVAEAWFHSGWALTLVGLALVGGELTSLAVPLTWSCATLTAWAVAKRLPNLEWAGWLATWATTHVWVAHFGRVYSTGQPAALVLPWLALTTAVLALGALWWSDGGQRRMVGLVGGWLGVAELTAGLSLIDTAHPREALVALVAGCLVLLGAARRAVRHDDARAAWLAQGVLAVAALAMRRLGAGAAPGQFEAWAALMSGPFLWGLSRFLVREQRPLAARALRDGAVVWPLVGLLAANWRDPRELVLLLLLHSAHDGWLAMRGGLKRTGASLAALAFNGAMVAAFFATQWDGVQDLALPAGLSLLALTWAFGDDLGRDVQVKLRAVAMTAVYAAAAWRPLTFSSAWGLTVCVVVCVAGVAAGAALRVRSYVLLGTAFLVTSVLATLVRQGLAEPRLGAALLALLGVSVVGFMVLFTTRRAEVLARLASVQKAMGSWEG